MSTLLKDRYSPEFYDEFCDIGKKVITDFNDAKFKEILFDESWASLELKERVRHTSQTLHEFMPEGFDNAAKVILKIVNEIRESNITDRGLEYFFLPDYIEVFGLESSDVSFNLMEVVTSLSTCEFAIRPFILAETEKTMKRMLQWSSHPDLHVRRLSSEGCRPRLPWAMGIPFFKKDPSPTIPILENLKNDESEFVRKSVANHLNDISKDHPQTALEIAAKWQGHSRETDWVVKHACRTLLKQGNPDAMKLFGFGSVDKIEISDLEIETPTVRIGSDLHFHFILKNRSSKDSLIRLEYGIYYQKANGTLSRKVFSISEKMYKSRSSNEVKRKQPFRLITTRKFHPGLHQLSIVTNGVEKTIMDFHVVS